MAVEVPRVDDGGSLGAAVGALYELTRVLRRECPWDQAQTAGTIVPHTLEEAYEVADVVRSLESGEVDDLHALEDELGDLLFQVCFLAMWCHEQAPEIDLASVARAIFDKLVRRHPHVFGDAVQASTADEVRGAWEDVKRDTEQRDVFDGIPRAMPALARARKVQGRAASLGFDFATVSDAVGKVEEELSELRAAIDAAQRGGTMPQGEEAPPDREVERELGDLLFAAVNVARLTRSDPDLALGESTARFRERVLGARDLADAAGHDFSGMGLAEQEEWYQRAKAGEAHRPTGGR